ncbi:MAG: helix-turn-helix transcriptional regulator [Thermoguttaceae bacterium]
METWDFTAAPVELGGVRYVVVQQTLFQALCEKAGVRPPASLDEGTSLASGATLDRLSLAERLMRRRRVAGLSQAELARRAGVRPETLNRIERGKTTPDFATIRKLVLAIDAAESQHGSAGKTPFKETDHVD